MKVTVVLSSYNGEKHIIRQIESILNQKDVEVQLCIRDDGSTDHTIQLLYKYREEHTRNSIKIIEGKNEGYAKSFWDALNAAQQADYYAFSDQDDIWMEDKLSKTIKGIETVGGSGNYPLLSYCRMHRVNEQLTPLDEQVNILCPDKLNRKMVLVQTYNYGAATLFNEEARKLICRCWPDVDDFPHDLWAGILCFLFGKIAYVDEGLYYWIRYNTSVTGEGTKVSGIKYRIRKTLKRKSYPNISKYLLEYYSDMLDTDYQRFLQDLTVYKENLPAKCRILFDKEFKRANVRGTLMLKLGITFNWF